MTDGSFALHSWLFLAQSVQISIPGSYFSDKGNILNQYFIKLGWFWTIACLIFYPTHSPKFHRLQRLLVATTFWFFLTKSFELLHYVSGSCSAIEIDNPRACSKGGHLWSGTDISGHCFLLILSYLMIWTETHPNLKEEPNGNLELFITRLTILIQILWLFGLLSTFLYFHTWADKVAGCFFGASVWYLIYRTDFNKKVWSRLADVYDFEKDHKQE